MAFESFDQAVNALVDANTGGSSSEPSSEQATAPVTQDSAQTAEGTPSSQDSIPVSVDLNSLPPEARAAAEQAIRGFQADYTRKAQEVAPLRHVMEEYGMDAEQARSALSLVQSLSDPEVQRQMYERLSSVYGDENVEYDEGMYDEGTGPDPRDRAIEQLTSRLDQFERAQTMSRIEVELDKMEMAVRSAHPDWNDTDIRRVQQLALAHQGNLITAADEYNSWRTDVVSSYVQGKGSVVPGTAPLSGTGHAETPTKFDTLDEAHAAAVQRYSAELGI